jgi:hypothetical protein
MKIPVFEEIILSSCSEEYLLHLFSDSRVGKVPSYINLFQLKNTDLNDLVLCLEKIFIELKINAKFPYPTYLIYNKNVSAMFPIVPSTKDLPDHFFKKVKRPNNKELQLLNKLSIKVDKLNNLNQDKIISSFFDSSLAQKELFMTTKELYFLEIINHQLSEKLHDKQYEKQKK